MLALVLLGELWLAPWSLFGLLVAALGGARPVDLLGPGWLWRAPETSLYARFLDRFGMAAQTVGAVVILRSTYEADQRIRRHELEHVRQGLVLGVLFPVAYLVALLVGGLTAGEGSFWWRCYRNNWLERRARAAAGE